MFTCFLLLRYKCNFATRVVVMTKIQDQCDWTTQQGRLQYPNATKREFGTGKSKSVLRGTSTPPVCMVPRFYSVVCLEQYRPTTAIFDRGTVRCTNNFDCQLHYPYYRYVLYCIRSKFRKSSTSIEKDVNGKVNYCISVDETSAGLSSANVGRQLRLKSFICS